MPASILNGCRVKETKYIIKAEIIEGFCLVKRIDLKKAKLSPDDYFRFEGKEIIFVISLDEKLLADISKNEEVSVITGMYGGTKEFVQVVFEIINKS